MNWFVEAQGAVLLDEVLGCGGEWLGVVLLVLAALIQPGIVLNVLLVAVGGTHPDAS